MIIDIMFRSMCYHVKDKLQHIPRDYHQYGYENEHTFYSALHRLHNRWKGWTGECVRESYGFKHLCFVGKYGNVNIIGLPDFMIERVPKPVRKEQPDNNIEDILDEVFGFE